MHTSEWSFNPLSFPQPAHYYSTAKTCLLSVRMAISHFPQSQHMSAPWNESHPSIHPFSLIIRTYISYNTRYTHYDYLFPASCSINKSAHFFTLSLLFFFSCPGLLIPSLFQHARIVSVQNRKKLGHI